MQDGDGPHELTLDEAVGLAVRLQQQQELPAADELLRRVLESAPEHPSALHFAGVLAHQQGRSDEAIALIERSLLLRPRAADWHSNLGIVYQSRGWCDKAIAAYREAIAIDPQHANAYCNLGVVLNAAGQPLEAEAAYRTAIELNPNHIDAHGNLGILLSGLHRTREAAACYCKVITLSPQHPEARRRLGVAHCVLGETEKAVAIFSDWLAEEPDNPIARHMLAACTGLNVPARASDAFVSSTFDSFANSFESVLQNLSYRAPALIAVLLEDSGLTAAKDLDVLDAGCGTGLCGPIVAPYARTLTGVDLSTAMLARAAEKSVYDELTQGELTQYLRSHEEAFDLIVSADALVYFGALDGVLDAAARALRADGLFLFTLEHAVTESEGLPYRLETHGRYSHERAAVERLLAAVGLQAEVFPGDLRMEAGSPVAGLVVRARKSAAPRPG